MDEENGRKSIMQIGHTNESKTFIPDVQAVSGQRLTFVDTPGFKDNRGPEINIANATNISATIQAAKSVRIMALLSYSELIAQRGRGLIELLGVLIELFGTTEQLKAVVSSIILGYARTNARTNAQTHTQTRTRTHAHTHTRTLARTHTRTNAPTHPPHACTHPHTGSPGHP